MDLRMVMMDTELLAYLDETLAVERTVLIERELRDNPAFRERLAQLSRERDQGGFSVGEIWTRERLSCLPRPVLERYLNRQTPAELTDYIEFHLNQLACRFCRANLSDLTRSQRSGKTAPPQRYFDSSAGILRKR